MNWRLEEEVEKYCKRAYAAEVEVERLRQEVDRLREALEEIQNAAKNAISVIEED